MKARRLDAVLEEKEPLPLEEALPIFQEFVRVLEAMQKQGKALGGIYPDQVLLEDGFAQIFELAAPRLPEDVTVSYLGFVPPELLEGQPPSQQTDVYSAAIILYVLLTGRVPFSASDREELTQQILHSQHDSFPQLPGLAQLEWIFKKCLLKVPSRRFANAQELGQELRKVLRPARASQAIPSTTQGPISVKKLQRRGREYGQLLQENWKIAAAAGGGLLLVLLVVLLWATRDEVQKVDRSPKSWSFRQLTATPDAEKDPSLSPDGGTIVFVSNMTGNWEIYVRGFGGGEAKQITESPGRESHPRWSPDGQLILFTYEAPGIDPTVFSVPPTGGIPQKMADNAIDAQWSRDGRSICYVTPAAAGPRSLEILDVAALNTRSVVKDIQGLAHPSFSADAKEIVCEADSDQGHRLFIVNVESGKIKAIKNVEGSTPTWDWATGWIYYTVQEKGSRRILRTDREGFTQPVTTGEGQDQLPTPSFNGHPVLFFREGFDRDVFRIAPEGSLPERVSPVVAESSFPRSLSARTLLFVRGREGQIRLESAIFGGSTATVLETLRAGAPLSVSPDGAYVYVEDPEEGKKGIWQVPTGGGNSLGLGEQLAAPYEVSPDRRSLFYGLRHEGGVRYVVKDLRSQEEKEVVSVPGQERIRRAAWLDNSSGVLLLTPDNTLSLYSLREGKLSTLLEQCHDFSKQPRSDNVAALAGPQRAGASLVMFDLRSRRQQKLLEFDAEAYAVTLDWSRDGSAVYYDRYKAGSDLYAAE